MWPYRLLIRYLGKKGLGTKQKCILVNENWKGVVGRICLKAQLKWYFEVAAIKANAEMIVLPNTVWSIK